MLTPNVVPDFTGMHVAVVGDLIADHYVFARPTRPSLEAPIMVMRQTGEEIGPGGAANAACNLWSLGAQTRLLGIVARDATGRDLLRKLEQEQIDVSGVGTHDDWQTPHKTRILGAGRGRSMQQLLRIDREPEEGVKEAVRVRVAERLRSLVDRIDALLISDYGYGLIDEEIASAAREIQEAGAICVLDLRGTLDPFHGIFALVANLAELAAATGRRPEDMTSPDVYVQAALELRERCESQLLLVTLGNRGMLLFSPEHPQGVGVAASGGCAVDVSGAGDTAAAAFTLALAAGLEAPRAMRLANAAAGVVVMEPGTFVCPLSRLRSELPGAPQPSLEVPAPVSGRA